MNNEQATEKVSKVDRYNWLMKDERGQLAYIPKTELRVDCSYQRDENKAKILTMARDWSWIACGTLIVAIRDGVFWVVDGQHRLAAALLRIDIKEMPCNVFETETPRTEAQGFLDANTCRKPMTALEKYKAMIVSGDEVALNMKKVLDRQNIVVTRDPRRGVETKSIDSLYRIAKKNFNTFVAVITLVKDLSIRDDVPIKSSLIEGLAYLHESAEVNLYDKLLRTRIEKIGAIRLTQAALRAAAYFVKGGYKVWGEGMLNEINKGCRILIKIK